MSDTFDALLRARRDAPSQRPRAESDAAAGQTPAVGEAVTPRLSVPAVHDRRARWHWPRWLRRQGDGRRAAAPAWPLLITPEGTGDMAEPFRVLRSSLLGLAGGTIMVTSALDQEGKTLCAANLAISLSLPVSADVVLVDLDLRRPSLGSRFGLRAGPGVVECLLGEAAWRDCLQATPYPRLKILSAGGHSHASPELLASEALRRMLADMRAFAETHFVLFDTPPVLLTADARTLVGEMDHVVLVVRAASTPKSAVQKAVQALGTEKMLGVVFNQAMVQFSDYYRYGKRYGSYGLPNGGTGSAT